MFDSVDRVVVDRVVVDRVVDRVVVETVVVVDRVVVETVVDRVVDTNDMVGTETKVETGSDTVRGVTVELKKSQHTSSTNFFKACNVSLYFSVIFMLIGKVEWK